MINPFTSYTPYLCYLSAVVTGNPTLITVTQPHAFVIGSQVQFLIPRQWGIQQLSGLTGIVSSVTSNTFTVNIDSSAFDAFITPVAVLPLVIDSPQVVAIGDTNTGSLVPGGQAPPLDIPGSFEPPIF
jgi:hypothetical protein